MHLCTSVPNAYLCRTVPNTYLYMSVPNAYLCTSIPNIYICTSVPNAYLCKSVPLCLGADIEVNRAYIALGRKWNFLICELSIATQVIKENFTSALGQYKITMSSPVCLRAEDKGSAATQVLCPEANGARHCVLAIHLYVSPYAYYMLLCVPGWISSSSYQLNVK